VNVLRRTRRKPSTIRGAAPDVVIGQSTPDARERIPTGADGMDRSYHFNGACHDLLTQLNSEIEDENEAKLGIWINLDSDHSIAHI